MPASILADVNAGSTKWGDAKPYKLEEQVTGKDKKGKPITELVLGVPEDPKAFIPQGSELYDWWVLFRDMPGTGACLKDTDIQCPPLLTQVRRLQYHLGALRYWIGDLGNPYAPLPFGKARKGHKPKPVKYANEGVFDVVTWNAVIAFQQDARQGLALRLPPDSDRKPLVDANLDPTAEASHPATQQAQSTKYVVEVKDPNNKDGLLDHDPEVAELAQISLDSNYEEVVDRCTGDGIKKWLKNSLRKPRAVLVCFGGRDPLDSWMNSRTLPKFREWDRKLTEAGFSKGLQVDGCLRDPRIGVDPSAKSGQISTSLHKSGFALDLLTSPTFLEGRGEAYPLYRGRDESVSEQKTRWIVYAKVPNKEILRLGMVTFNDPDTSEVLGFRSPDPAKAYIEYKLSICPFEYDETSPEGGAAGDPIPEDGPDAGPDGFSFLNVTKIAHSCGFARIGPHADWNDVPAEQFTLASRSDLSAVLASISKHSKRKEAKSFTVGGAEITFKAFSDALAVLNLWVGFAAKFGYDAAPDLKVQPTEKQGEEICKRLRMSAHKLQGKNSKKMVLTLIEDPDPKTSQAPAPRTLQLAKDTEFPAKVGFTLRPVTTPEVKAGAIISLPELVGQGAMTQEWWHFQWVDGYQGKAWGSLLKDFGWTEMGLLAEKSPYGFVGLGYARGEKGIDKAESTGLEN